MRRDNDETFEQIFAAAEDALEGDEQTTESPYKRQRNLPSIFIDSIVYSTVRHADALSIATTTQQSLRVLLIKILHNTIVEIKRNFSENNISLLSVISHLSPAKENCLSPVDLKSFADLIECKVNDSFTSECEVAKSYILRQINSIRYANPTIAHEICELLYPIQSGFPLVNKIYAAALTFDSRTAAVCEASFSTLYRVLKHYRRSITHTRKQNLVLLLFLNSYTKNVGFDEILRKFARWSRKIQLFQLYLLCLLLS